MSYCVRDGVAENVSAHNSSKWAGKLCLSNLGSNTHFQFGFIYLQYIVLEYLQCVCVCMYNSNTDELIQW